MEIIKSNIEEKHEGIEYLYVFYELASHKKGTDSKYAISKTYYFQKEEQFYNTHTGSLNGIDYSFNYEFIINETNFSTVYVDVNINNFYNNPIYSFEEYGSGIMQNEAAQQNIFNNLNDVFSIETN